MSTGMSFLSPDVFKQPPKVVWDAAEGIHRITRTHSNPGEVESLYLMGKPAFCI